MPKGQDVIVLLKLCRAGEPETVRSLSAGLGLPHAAVQRSLKRLEGAGLYDAKRRRVNRARAEEFLVHAVKFMFPAEFAGEGRGVPTAWAADPLRKHLAPSGELPPVWPHPRGKARGIVLEPLHESAPELERRDPELAQTLFIVDALRVGDARQRGIATRLLRERLEPAPL